MKNNKGITYILSHKKWIIGAVLILAVLVFTFWYGDGSQSSRGFWTAKETQNQNDTSDQSGSNTDWQLLDQSAQSLQDDTGNAEGQTLESDSDSDTDMKKQDDGQDSNQNTDSNAAGTDQEESSENSGLTANAEEQNTGNQNSDSQNAAGQQAGSGQETSQDLADDQDTQAEACTISISCATVLNHMDQLKSSKVSLIPADGWILAPLTVTLQSGDSVFDVLNTVCKANRIHMESSWTPGYNSAYVEGINNLYEFDCGSLSGWVYSINGQILNNGASATTVKSGDTIRWMYTCDLGNDVK